MEHSHVLILLRSCSACGWTHKRPCHPCLCKTSKAPLLNDQQGRSLCRRSAQIQTAALGSYPHDGRRSPRWLAVRWPTFQSPAGRVYDTRFPELGSQRMARPILGPIATCQMVFHKASVISTYRLKTISICENGHPSSRSFLPPIVDALQVPIEEPLQVVDVPWCVKIEPLLSRMKADPFVL
jgi:hypothetical protein